jgi:hypothetical protein
MQFLRKLGLGLALALYMPLLLLLPTMVSLNATIVKPTFVKETLVKAQFYEGLNSFIVEQVSKNPDMAGNALLITSIQQAASPAELQKIIEPPVDGIYKWLDNPEEKFDVKVSFEPLKQNFIRIMEQNLQTKLTTLPRCPTRSVPSTDPFEMTCLPQGVSVQQVLDQAKAEAEQNKEILGEEQGISLGEPAPAPQAEGTTQPTNKKETPQFDTNQLKFYAKLYKWVKVGTPWIIGLTVLATLGIALLSKPRYKGLRRLGVLLIISGVILLATSLVTAFALRTFLPTPATGGSLTAAGSKVADIISKRVLSISQIFTMVYAGVGIVSIIASIIIGKVAKGKHPSSPIEQENMLPKDDSLANKPEPKIEDKASETKVEKDTPKEKKIDVS